VSPASGLPEKYMSAGVDDEQDAMNFFQRAFWSWSSDPGRLYTAPNALASFA
jgi:hypothetical protein